MESRVAEERARSDRLQRQVTMCQEELRGVLDSVRDAAGMGNGNGGGSDGLSGGGGGQAQRQGRDSEGARGVSPRGGIGVQLGVEPQAT